MSIAAIAAAADALKAADESLAAAKVIRAEAHEALIAAMCDAGWHIVFSHHQGDGHHRVVVERYGRALDVEAAVAEVLHEAVA